MISLVCSVYNAEKYLPTYLNYVNSQILARFEVVFVDANSSDNSLSMIKEFKFREGIKVQVIECDTRVSIYEAWNLGIQASTYDYVMNYNTDDKLFSGALMLLYCYILQHPEADVVYSNCFVSDNIDHSRLVGFYNWKNADNLSTLLGGCCCGPFPLLKKESIIEQGLFNPEFTISGDYEMWCRMKYNGKRFHKVEEALGVYYHNPKGVSTDPENNKEHIRQDTLIRQLYSK